MEKRKKMLLKYMKNRSQLFHYRLCKINKRKVSRDQLWRNNWKHKLTSFGLILPLVANRKKNSFQIQFISVYSGSIDPASPKSN